MGPNPSDKRGANGTTVNATAMAANGATIVHRRNGAQNGQNGHHTPKKNGSVPQRRPNSVGRATDIQGKERRERAEQPDSPCHEPQDSLLSSSSGYTNYRGVLNLFFILLVLSNARVALENVIKYGVLVDPIQWLAVLGDPDILPSVQIILGLNVFLFNAFFLEKHLFVNGKFSEQHNRILIGINAAAVIVVPAALVYTLPNVHPIGSSVALSFAAMLFLKLISYHMVNYWCRKSIGRFQRTSSVAENLEQEAATARYTIATRSVTERHRRYRSYSHNIAAQAVEQQAPAAAGTHNNNGKVNGKVKPPEPDIYFDASEDKVHYPNNLTLGDLYYFTFAPTLCYELNFPRSQRIRKRFLIRRGLEVIFLLQLVLALIQQWLVPTIQNSTGPLQEMHFPKMMERLLKLAIPNHIIWLIFFYWYFHSCTNFIGEIMRFADREFYRDWWNANSVPYFWSNWNIPVHKWCLRHLYKPLLSYGWTRFQASVLVFCVSAFFHEYIVSVPLKMFRVWAFSGMLFQIPFAMAVSRLQNYPQWANTAVWLSLIIGQPLCILMYFHDYYVENLLVVAPTPPSG